MIYVGGNNMKNEINCLLKRFFEIKDMGWVKSVRKGYNGIGVTFESLLGIQENELEIPDYNGIEIKTKRYGSMSYITLFSYTPEGPRYHEVERLKDKYGYPHKKFSQYNVLNNSVYCNIKNKIGNKSYFKLHIDRKSEKMYLEIYNLNGNLIEKEVYWCFDIMKEKLYRKMKLLAFVKAISKKVNGDEYFKYYGLNIYILKDFETFVTLLEKGVIRLNFKLNIRTTEEKRGQIYDHGTSFSISEENLDKLYIKYSKE